MAMCTALACRDPLERSLREWATEICQRHRSHLRELWFKAVQRGVVISGVARSYYGKQLALCELQRRCGLPVIANQIEVEAPEPGANFPTNRIGG
ncbi:hypothetical protein [Gemmata massiliana]|nr:hypothetical protein [Gemmata massiliana]